MTSSTARRGGRRRILTGVVVTLATFLLLAAPALAAPHSTKLTAHANSTLLNYGGGTLISAVLMDTVDMVAVGGQWVRVEQATSASGPWSLLYIVTTSSGTYATGTYSGPVIPAQNTWYRFVFQGTAAYAASTSNVLAIRVKPLLGKPSCRAKIRHRKKFTVKGSLKPHFTAGAKTVKIRVFRLNSHKKWRVYKNYSARNYDYKGYTQYRLRLKIVKKGTYRFKARTNATAAWAAVASGYSRRLTVN